MTYIYIKNIEKYFGKNKVLDDINIDINKGEFISLLGPSGCGKTTLLRIISGLESKTKGHIFVEDKDISKISPGKRNIGLVFQNYVLFPNLSVYENVAYGLINKKMSEHEIEKRVNDILIKVDLLHMKHKYPKQLSGGQQQRIALARSIVISPNILLLDEPLSALDAKVRQSLRQEIKAIQREFGITTIMVTHDQEEALTMSDKIVLLNKGKIMQIGTPKDIYNNPLNEFVANFIGEVNYIKGDNNEKLVRPENIILSNKQKDKYKKCIVKQIEFRGALYRVVIEDCKSKCNFIVDILSHSKEKYGVKEYEEMYYRIV